MTRSQDAFEDVRLFEPAHFGDLGKRDAKRKVVGVRSADAERGIHGHPPAAFIGARGDSKRVFEARADLAAVGVLDDVREGIQEGALVWFLAQP